MIKVDAAKKRRIIEKKLLTEARVIRYKRDSFGAGKRLAPGGLEKKIKKEVDKAEWF